MLTAPAHMPDISMWAAIAVTTLCIFGALLSLLGSVGLKTLKNMYERLHAPTLASTLGMATIVAAMVIYFSCVEGQLTLKPLLIAIFLTVTTPVTMILLARASIYRDRVEGREGVPKDDM